MARFDLPDPNAATTAPSAPQVVPSPVAPTVSPPVTVIASTQPVNPVVQNIVGQQATDVARAETIAAQTDQMVQQEQVSKQEEHWIKAYWRPAMGWLYMAICFFDFIAFPALTIFLPIIMKMFGIISPYKEWQSLTLSNGGLIHLAFGAILGVSAWSRGQEKILKM